MENINLEALIFLIGSIETEEGGVTGQSIVEKILAKDGSLKESEPIYLYISSPGGDMGEASAIMSAIQYVRMGGRRVIGLVAGDAWSAAFYVLQACDERIMFPLTSLLVHEPWFDGGDSETSTQKLVTGQFAKHLEKQFFAQLATRTGRSVKFYQDKVRNGEWFLDPETALYEGFIDKILSIPPLKSSPAIPLPKRKKAKTDEHFTSAIPVVQDEVSEPCR